MICCYQFGHGSNLTIMRVTWKSAWMNGWSLSSFFCCSQFLKKDDFQNSLLEIDIDGYYPEIYPQDGLWLSIYCVDDDDGYIENTLQKAATHLIFKVMKYIKVYNI